MQQPATCHVGITSLIPSYFFRARAAHALGSSRSFIPRDYVTSVDGSGVTVSSRTSFNEVGIGHHASRVPRGRRTWWGGLFGSHVADTWARPALIVDYLLQGVSSSKSRSNPKNAASDTSGRAGTAADLAHEDCFGMRVYQLIEKGKSIAIYVRTTRFPPSIAPLGTTLLSGQCSLFASKRRAPLPATLQGRALASTFTDTGARFLWATVWCAFNADRRGDIVVEGGDQDGAAKRTAAAGRSRSSMGMNHDGLRRSMAPSEKCFGFWSAKAGR
jgi:hypothetical protein